MENIYESSYTENIENIEKWYELLKTKKDMILKVFSCMKESEVEINEEGQMEQIYLGIKNGLSSSEIMLYADTYLDTYEWERIREALELGIPFHMIKSIVDNEEGYDFDAIDRIKREYFLELLHHEDDKDKPEM